jgi:hypothetical protein
MANTVTEQRANWWPAAVGLLASVWIGVTLYLFGRLLKLGGEVWALTYDGGEPAGVQAQAAAKDALDAAFDYMLLAIGVGSLVTAIVAAVGRLRSAAKVFTLIAIPALLLGSYAWTNSARDDTTPPQQPPANQCLVRAGGCPGG